MFDCYLLKKAFNSLLSKSITHENAICYFELSRLFHLPCLQNQVFEFIQRWFCFLAANKRHLDLSFASLRKLLFSSELDVTSETEVVFAAEEWIKHDDMRRSKLAKELVKTIRWPLLSQASLETLLAENNSFSKNKDIKKRIEKAISEKSNAKPSSVCYQFRYCSQKNFEIMLCGVSITNKHCLYKAENGRLFKESEIVDNVLKTDTRICHSVLINGVIYLFGNNYIYLYSTLVKKLLKKKHLPRQTVDDSCSLCNFMGRIHITGWYDRALTVYDPEGDAWEKRAEMTVTRMHAACSAFRGRVVVSGGLKYEDLDGRVSRTLAVEAYDHASDSWSSMPRMIGSRSHHASVSIGSKLYVIGGLYGKGFSCEVFDFFSNTFVGVRNAMPYFGGVHPVSVRCLSIGNAITVFNESSSKEHVVFDAEKREWSGVYENVSRRKYIYCTSCIKLPMF